MTEKRFELEISSFSGKHMKFLNILDNGKRLNSEEIVDLLNEQQEQLDLYKEAILTMLGILADKGIIFSGVKDE